MTEWLAYAGARGLVESLARLPRLQALTVAQQVMRGLDKAVPRLRRIGHTNLELALPRLGAAEREEVLDGVFRSLARVLVAFAHLPHLNRKNVSEWIGYEGFEHYRLAKERGGGVLFATAHLGNWELSAYAHALLTEPMHVVVRPLDNPLVDAFVERRRAASGNWIIGKREGARTILRALQQNEAVGVLVDQNVLRDQGEFIEFFGTPACTQTVFAKLAHRAGTTVLPGFALWSEAEQRYVLRFYSPIAMTGQVRADTQAIQGAVEQAIREYPDQWLWIHRRWKTRPAGEKELY